MWETAELRDELKLGLDGPGRYFWAGTEAGMLGSYGFQGIHAGGDGSAHQGRIVVPTGPPSRVDAWGGAWEAVEDVPCRPCI